MMMWRFVSSSLLFIGILRVIDATEEINHGRLIDLMRSDRAGMIKLYQPWCGHCTRMKPDWDMLAEHYADDSSIFIADVNCEVEEKLCESFHPGGTYPTILVFPRGDGHRPPPTLYEGGRGFEDLKKFVDKQLVRSCDIRNPQGTCNDKAREYISKWDGKSRKEQEKEISRLKSLDSEMTYDLSKWVNDRINVLQQLVDQQEEEVAEENEL